MKDVVEYLLRTFQKGEMAITKELAFNLGNLVKFLALEGKLPYSKENFIGIDKSKIYFALTELEKKGIIRKTERGKYTFVNPFFPEYIRLLSRGELV